MMDVKENSNYEKDHIKNISSPKLSRDKFNENYNKDKDKYHDKEKDSHSQREKYDKG